MILKKSLYNVEVDRLDNGDILLFNSSTSAFGIMNVKTQELVFNSESIDEDKVEDKDNISVMKSNGFLVDNEIDEYTRMEITGRLQRYSKTTFGLTIAPTINCNMACPYCYEEKSNKRMSEEVKTSLINFVENNIKGDKIKSFHVTWYGGEPLLEKDLILDLSKEFIKITKDNGVLYSAGIVTNGSLLDYETAKMLKNECNVTFAQITIDGLREVHNSRRILKNGMDSFGIITDNIDNCKELINISIRVNVDKSNVEEAKKLVDYFINERKWIDNSVTYYFAPVDKQTDACNAEISSCFSPNEFGKIDAELLRLIYQKGNMESITRLYPRGRAVSCGALGCNGYVLDPEGYLYKCWDVIGIKKYSVGDIFSGPRLNGEYLKWLSLDLPNDCKSCNMLPICQGGCAYARLRNGNKPICNHKTISFNENLKIVYEEFLKDKKIKAV
jgi:uncharacterized protein